MTDARPDHRPRCPRCSARPTATPVPSTAASPTATGRWIRRHAARDPRARQGHRAARDRPQRRVGGVLRRRATGVGPPVRAMLDNPPILVTAFVEGTPVTEEELRRPDLLWNVAGALRRIHDSEEELPSNFSAFRIVEDVRRDRPTAAAARCPTATTPPQAREGDREGAARARARAGALPQRPAGRQPAARGDERSGSSTGSTRAWATATSTSATSR